MPLSAAGSASIRGGACSEGCFEDDTVYYPMGAGDPYPYRYYYADGEPTSNAWSGYSRTLVNEQPDPVGPSIQFRRFASGTRYCGTDVPGEADGAAGESSGPYDEYRRVCIENPDPK
jgi:hypothetical protein